MLPLFTDGRYEHLQIDDGLKVRVFSNDKRDFMDLEEVSSGTQRRDHARTAPGPVEEAAPVARSRACSLPSSTNHSRFSIRNAHGTLHALADLGMTSARCGSLRRTSPTTAIGSTPRSTATARAIP